MNAEQILDTLKTGAYTVTFRKADGSLRTMQGWAPAETVIRTAGIVPIIEMGTFTFKSFRADNLISISEFNPYV
jgi:hypothetical protein